ncbi:MAG: arginyl-tRNA synthetase [Parcubacteria group bacterium Gr01-1014_33]|nr:MAG: arginyl-tRNA synthetase [Parcubacteria group bacterium Gr01-1014_33]
MLRANLKNAISEAIRNKFGDIAIPEFSVEIPENPEHGDYATNAALILAHTLKQSPMEIVALLSVELEAKNPELRKIEVVPPGFINFILSDKELLARIEGVLQNPDEWGKSKDGQGKTVMVEYLQLNIAKRPHVGHLRSAVIGDAIKRTLDSQGYHAVSDTHVGDWGTQFGILLWAYKQADKDTKKKIEEDPFSQLEVLYQTANKDENANEFGKAEFAKLEKGDTENRKIWQWMVEISMEKLEESASRLGLLSFDEHKGESSYENDMPAIVTLTLEKGVAKKTEEGAVIVDLENEGLDQAILVKSDGASTYLLRDLATIKYRKEHWNFWKNLYLVDVRQSHHFKQVFRVAELLRFEGVNESEHVEYGFMSLPTGAISTRAGNIISLEAVCDEAIHRAREVIKEKNPDLENANVVAHKVGIGALKYFDLSHNRRSDIIFKWDEALSFEGNTGPYIQYTYARLKSILRKTTDQDVEHSVSNTIGLDSLEHRLVAAGLRLGETIEDALEDFMPNILANYLYNLAKLANEFYHSHPVLQESDPAKKQFRLSLISLVALTLAKGLSLLGIDAPEEM